MIKIKKDQVLGIIVLMIAAFFVYHTSKLPSTAFVGDPGPAMFPYIGSFITGLCGILLIIFPEKEEGKVFLTKKQWFQALLLLSVYVLYYVLIVFFGLIVAMPVVLFIISLLFSYLSKKDEPIKPRLLKTLVYSVIVGVLFYLFARAFIGTQMPGGMFLNI